MNWKIKCSTIAGLLISATIIILSFYVSEDKNGNFAKIVLVLNLAILALGFSVGWVIGIMISPYDNKETARFSALSKAVGVFASGYLVGKIDKLVEKILNPDFILDSVHGFRAISFITAVIVAMLITFVYRWYARVD
jgi:hypothetical protein